MPLTDVEFDSILIEEKYIRSNIVWSGDADHSPALEFRADVESITGSPMFVHGRFNKSAGTLNFALVLKTTGRIYALDLGKAHHNPGCTMVGERHKHRWSEQYRDKEAYEPDDITAGIDDPVSVWKEFCAEAHICHTGEMIHPEIQEELQL